ncbi:MAG: T9SS type A sorting domain-containing protein [Bacteroidota bacterium]|nr:T9SS type A sorting domain-containing protein [Bacteroidota bacterium]
MKKSFYLVLVILILGVFLGFSNSDNPNRLTKSKLAKEQPAPIVADNNNPITTSGVDYYSDDFDAPNDTTALKLRGYLIFRNGTFSGTPGASWFTGNPNVFPAFNGDPDDYVGSNFQSAGSLGDIDNWLILPELDVVANDSICFRSRAPLASTFPDSIRVMFNPLGGTTPDAAGWTELGRFKVNTSGLWELRSFVIPSTALSARLAIRYAVVDGGLNGANSDFIGIDELRVQGQGVLPVELSSFVSVISNNNVTLNWTTATETNNSGFEILRAGSDNHWNTIDFITGHNTTTTPTNYTFTDRNLNLGIYNYKLKQIDLNGNFQYYDLSNEVVIGVPVKFELSQNYPNPFNPSTKIEYQLPKDGNVNISVYDNSGKEIMSLVNEFKTAGFYTVNFNGSSISSGIYFYKISSGNFSGVKKMMLVK